MVDANAITLRLQILALTFLTLAAVSASQSCTTPLPVVAHSTLATVCSQEPARRAIGCSMYRLCTSQTLNPPILPALCHTWRIASSLCYDDADISGSISLCSQLQASFPGTAQFRACLVPYFMNSTSLIVQKHLWACGNMWDLSAMRGCESCTESSCPDPLVSYSDGCWDMDMDQCDPWDAFCQLQAAPTSNRATFGQWAAVLCKRPNERTDIVLPPRPTSPPPDSQPPMPPVPARSGPPPPSPPFSCLADPSLPECVSYEYPLANITADITHLCTAMPYMPGCTIADACKAGLVTGNFCRPLTLLATICVDMPGMGGCRSYVPLCRNTSVVQQCKRFPNISGLPSTMQAKTAVLGLCAAINQSNPLCTNCTQRSCPDYLTPLASLCTSTPGMDGCATYWDWCRAAGAFGPGLTIFCTTRFPPPTMSRPPPVVNHSLLLPPKPQSTPPSSWPSPSPSPPKSKSPPPPKAAKPPPPKPTPPPPLTATKPSPTPKAKPPSPKAAKSPPPKAQSPATGKGKPPPPSNTKRSPPPSKKSPPPSTRQMPPCLGFCRPV